MSRPRKKDPVTLARQLLESLGQPVPPANEDEPVIDEERRRELRELARADAEQMRRARNR